jgi:gamma-glutamyltranspeptidase/glutathione hydrolase
MTLALTLLLTAQVGQVTTTGGLVVSDQAIASEVGAEIMRKGGNAVDAAVATGFALAVTLPSAGNIGGGGFMVVRMKDGTAVAIDYREIAPTKATRDMYLDAAGNVVPGLSTVGRKAAGVPGTVAGFWLAHQRYGRLKWSEVVEPSVRLAREGFVLGEGQAAGLRGSASLFKQFEDSWRIFCRSGDFYREGEKLVQTDLALTLERIRDQGRDGFYKGETSRLMCEDAAVNGGLFTQQDFDIYEAKVREPVRGSYRGYDVITMPPPSSGGVALVEMLNVLELHSLSGMEPGSAAYVHLLVETMKRAFADRAQHMGDPDFVNVPVEALTLKQYAVSLNRGISLTRATPSSQIKAGVFPPHEGTNTTHFSVVDREGNAVANTYTLNTGYGCGAVAAGTGVLLNNEMDDFTSKPGVPNTYGLIQGEANAIAPLKRPLSSMTPTIVVKSGSLFMVTGSPGGPTIINTVMHSFLNVVEHGMTVQQSVSFPRFHHQWLPDEVMWERFALSAETRAELATMGQRIAGRAVSIGSCHAILVEASGKRRAGLDPRISSGGIGVAD